jgi:hypothetical protein
MHAALFLSMSLKGKGVAVNIDNNATGLAEGAFTLAPGHYGQLSWTSEPSFLMLGQ